MGSTLNKILLPSLSLLAAGAGIFLGWLIRSDRGNLEVAVWVGLPLAPFILMLMAVAVIVPVVSHEMRRYWYYFVFCIIAALLFTVGLALTLYKLPQQP